MTEPRTFVDLTQPIIGQAILHVQKEGAELQQFELSREHLFKLNKQIADILTNRQSK